MTIQEAIKSGRPFRRPDWADGIYIFVSPKNCGILTFCDTGNSLFAEAEDILADDWEIKND